MVVGVAIVGWFSVGCTFMYLDGDVLMALPSVVLHGVAATRG
jgi:hypothetical protein